uniref:Uncharacterized protein n=1 Tax=Arundo donax TaxID=35708 RepID=A0A0A9H730_ARUDO
MSLTILPLYICVFFVDHKMQVSHVGLYSLVHLPIF